MDKPLTKFVYLREHNHKLLYKTCIMRIINRIFAIFLAVFLFASCGEDRTYQYLELTEECQWIYAQMKESYLWSDSIKQPARNKFFSKSSDFYKGLLLNTDKTSFFGDSASATTYGISYTAMRDPLGIQPSRIYALVLYVEPHSPAHRAGITRGMWISGVGNKEITTSNHTLLANGDATTLRTSRITFDEEQAKHVWSTADTLQIDAAEANGPIAVPLDSIYKRDHANIGYVVINRFEEGTAAIGVSGILNRMDGEQATEIIIDLRYNNGGSLKEAAECASLLVPESNGGKIFCTTHTNSNLSQTESYALGKASTLSPAEKIYILTSDATKGVAQTFISSLQQIIGTEQIVVIGESANIQPYITESIASPYGFTISPVVATIYTANGKVLTPNSISVAHRLNEINDVNIFPLGDTQETLLSKALSIIEE